MESVIKQLLSMVCDMKPEVHVNYRATNWMCSTHPSP
jgi:V-type H+-transporting ATPase subunit G